MENDVKETIKLKGSTGKVISITYEELLKRKITGKVEVVGSKYYVKITRWYSLNKEFESLNEATSALVKFVQKIEKMKKENK